jgi:hypothetical protein
VFFLRDDCFRYEVLGFDPDAPIYGCPNREPVFTFDFENDPMFQFAEGAVDLKSGGRGVARGAKDFAVGLFDLAENLVGAAAYNQLKWVNSGLAETLFGPQKAGRDAMVSGVRQLAWDIENYLAFKLIAPFNEDYARSVYGANLDRLGNVLNGMTGGSDAGALERTTYTVTQIVTPGAIGKVATASRAGVAAVATANRARLSAMGAKAAAVWSKATAAAETAVAATAKAFGGAGQCLKRLYDRLPLVEAGAKNVQFRRRIVENISNSRLARERSNFDLHVARESQIYGAYGGVDPWVRGRLRRGTIIYGGVPGQTAYYFDFATASRSALGSETLWKSLQVAPHPHYGYRMKMQAYRVLEDLEIPMGPTINNPQLGAGGGFQYYIWDFHRYLEPVRTFSLH